ncbi:MAP kinase-activating death domain protein isoform X2 [Nematostella vectensis]|uniref:MAP kinase-activating death domain protein isoform X2 n=1 Tax=Nematostella vectensis TaxID=45351 RepID=UPI0020778CEE|nr:MAP kinase-activating death domain protein isoform X2 [Nematostella vectensis]
MGDKKRKFPQKRLVDYVILVGVRTPTLDSTETPRLLRRFPEKDHDDFPLPPDVVFFCQPEACNTVSKKFSLREANSFIFTLTDKDTNKVRYGVCMNIYRPCSQFHFRDDQDGIKDGKRKRSRSKNKREICMTLTSICIVSHHSFFATFRECLFVLRKMIDSRVGGERYDKNDNFIPGLHSWSVFTCSEDPKLSPIATQMDEIETWIQRLLLAPAPVIGRTKVDMELLCPESYPSLTFAYPENTRFPLIDFPVHIPMELLGVETCLKVLTCILLEQKVVIQSRDYNALTMSVIALTRLLYPLEYMFPIIPLLPTCMANAEQLLLAPTPYVIGVPASFFRYKSKDFQIPGDLWVFDLDSSKMTVPMSADELPDLPEEEGQVLIRRLKMALQALSMPPQTVGNLENAAPDGLLPDNTSGDASIEEHMVFGNDVDSVDVAVRVAIVNFFMSPTVLCGLQEHTRTLRLFPRPVVALQKGPFLKSRPKPSDFVAALAESQSVEYFAEWLVSPTNTAYLKINKGIYNPCVIGDKPKWYSEHLETVLYQVYDKESKLCLEPWIDVDYEPSLIFDEEEATPNNDEDDDSSSCYSSVSDLVQQMISGDINGATPAAIQVPPFNPVRASSPMPHVQASFSLPETLTHGLYLGVPQRETGRLRSISDVAASMAGSDSGTAASTDSAAGSLCSSDSYSAHGEETDDFMFSVSNPPSPPTDHRRTTSDTDSERTCTSDVEQSLQSGSSGTAVLTKAESPSAEPMSVMAGFLNSIKKTTISVAKMARQETEEPLVKEGVTRRITPAGTPQLTGSRMPPAPGDDKNHFPFPGVRQRNGMDKPPTRTSQLSRQTSLEKAIQSDNQQFLKEILRNVMRGDGVGWLTSKRLRRLMTEEPLRLMVASHLYSAPTATDEGEVIEDTRIPRNVYKGMLEILRAVVAGYEASVVNHGIGGVASAFKFLEIIHTNYYGRDIREETANKREEDELSIVSTGSLSNLSDQSDTHSAGSSLSSSAQELAHARRRGYANGESDRDSGHGGSEIETVMMPSHRSHDDVSRHNPVSRANSDITTMMLNSKKKNWTRDPRLTRTLSADHETKQRIRKEAEQKKERSKSPTLAHMKLSESGSRRSSMELATSTALSLPPPGPLLKKSNLSRGYRYFNGDLIPIEGDDTDRSTTGRRYLFEGLVRERSPLWDNMDFWENIFLDAVAAERDAVGMDQGPTEMLERYKSLQPVEQKRLEEEEDKLLATTLYNTVAFMVALDVDRDTIRKKIRRLLGKSHIGLNQSQLVNDLLENLHNLNGNDIDLRPTGSRQMKKQSFVVHSGSTMNGDVFFMEVSDDCILLRTGAGVIIERWWYEKMVNITYCPKTKVLCLWYRRGEDTLLSKFCTKKCKALYFCIKECMQRAAERLRGPNTGPQLGGEFLVEDISSGEEGKLQVTLEGIGLKFATRRVHIDLCHIRNCSTQKGEFVLDEFVPFTQDVIQHRFKSPMCNQICYAVLCLFSYVAASRNSDGSNR